MFKVGQLLECVFVASIFSSFPDPYLSMLAEHLPSEISLTWVYLPPFMITVVLGYLATLGLTRLLNATGLSRYFWRPEIGFLAFWVMLTSLIGLFILPP
mgnify:CR=1 FL=1